MTSNTTRSTIRRRTVDSTTIMQKNDRTNGALQENSKMTSQQVAFENASSENIERKKSQRKIIKRRKATSGGSGKTEGHLPHMHQKKTMHQKKRIH